MRLYWDNKIRVNVTGVSEYGLKMDLCKEVKKISGHTHRGSLACKVSINSILLSSP
jgi:hypothetical protein